MFNWAVEIAPWLAAGCVQGAHVVCGTKRQHSDNMESSSVQQKHARIDTDADDMDLDESGMMCCMLAVVYICIQSYA